MQIEAWFVKYRLVILAAVGSLVFHSVLLMAGSYRGTYDAYVHIFFADHYARSWWNPWEPRWYTGFTMFSYPPLTHQLTALLSRPFGLLAGFSIVMAISTFVTTVGVYRFSRLWVNHRASSYAALLALLSSSIAETVHVFGQLPTMFVIGIMLNALPFVWSWIETANVRDLLRGWAMLMMAAAGHHVTTLFGMIFFCGPILATLLLRKFRTPLKAETPIEDTRLSLRKLWQFAIRRVRRTLPALIRSGIFGAGLVAILVITVLPYWLWSSSDPITQITIPHASRDSFLKNTAAGLVFFLIPWGIQLLILPYALYKGFSSQNWILAGSLAALALLGTGGTTPIPALLLRGSFYILTLDRFTFWATILILPFSGQFIESLLHGRLGRWITAHFGKGWQVGTIAILGISMGGMLLFTANLTQFRRFQPATVDMTPIVEFLAKDNHDRWRYLTLGFGDQMAWLSAQTPALDVEGNYHSARRLPELTSTPIERLDGAKFTEIPGLGSLQQFVVNPQRYNLKYIFVNDAFYEPLLFFAGWHRLGRLENQVQVWERADVPPLPAAIPAQIYPAWQRLMWGLLPVGSLFVTATMFLFTGVIAPLFHWSIETTPLLRNVANWPFIRFWLLDRDMGIPLPPNGDWHLWEKITRRLFPGMRLKPLRFRRWYGLVLLLIVGGVVGGVAFLSNRPQSPQAAVLAYYDAIDFKRFSQSYAYLSTPLTQQEYLRWLSLRGGILASFAKLNNLYVTISDDAPPQKSAHVTSEWLTALGTYTVTEDWRMVPIKQGWQLVLNVEPPSLPRETFIDTTNANFYLDLPLGSLDPALLSRGPLDRTLLSVSPARVVYRPDHAIGFTPKPYDAARITGRFSGLITVVGAVSNHSSYPSQVTITAILRDAAGRRLAETNAMDMMLHQLLPGEATPFRIDFAGADAVKILNIEDIVSVDLIVRGVPTAHNLSRPLTLLSTHQLYNSSAIAVDVPRVLESYLDQNGKLLWVDGQYLERSISPDEVLNFESVKLPSTLQPLDLPITVSGPRLTPWTETIPQTVVYGYSR